MNIKKCLLITFAWLFNVTVANTLNAAQDSQHQHNHDHGASAQQGEMSHAMHEMFLQKREVDGYNVSFHVMQAQEGMRHGGSHNFMIKVEQGSKILDDVIINSKVIYPDGKSESKALMKMGDWYMNGYDLKAEGKHQMLILFKTSDGKKHQAGVYYPEGN